MIICPAGKGTLTEDACRACALRGDNVCGYDYALLTMMYNNPGREGIHVSDLTMCLRKAHFDKKDPQPELVSSKIKMLSGTMFHKLAEIQDDKYVSEVNLELDGLVGRADVYYHDGVVLDFKTKSGLYVNMGPNDHHVVQVQIYGYMFMRSGKPVHTLRIQYIDLNGPSKCSKHKKAKLTMDSGAWVCPVCGDSKMSWHGGAVFYDIPILSDKEVKELIQVRKSELEGSLNNGHLPTAEVGWLCDYCPHVKNCPEGSQYQSGG